jgi:hypothetical protein
MGAGMIKRAHRSIPLVRTGGFVTAKAVDRGVFKPLGNSWNYVAREMHLPSIGGAEDPGAWGGCSGQRYRSPLRLRPS